jgi:hypothetical protein
LAYAFWQFYAVGRIEDGHGSERGPDTGFDKLGPVDGRQTKQEIRVMADWQIDEQADEASVTLHAC